MSAPGLMAVAKQVLLGSLITFLEFLVTGPFSFLLPLSLCWSAVNFRGDPDHVENWGAGHFQVSSRVPWPDNSIVLDQGYFTRQCIHQFMFPSLINWRPNCLEVSTASRSQLPRGPIWTWWCLVVNCRDMSQNNMVDGSFGLVTWFDFQSSDWE